MKKVKRLLIILILVMICMVTFGQQRVIGYSGFVVDSATQLPIQGTSNMIFKIYDVASGGTELWSETYDNVIPNQDNSQITINDGEFSVYLGSINPFDADPDIDFFSTIQYYLEITVEADVMAPRKKITYVPYAFVSDGVIIENRTDDPISPQTGRMWLRTDL